MENPTENVKPDRFSCPKSNSQFIVTTRTIVIDHNNHRLRVSDVAASSTPFSNLVKVTSEPTAQERCWIKTGKLKTWVEVLILLILNHDAQIDRTFRYTILMQV